MESISPVNSNATPNYSSLLGALGGSNGTFDSVFNQTMSQAKTPQQQAQTAFLQVEYDNLNALYSAVSGATDPLMGSLGDSMGLEMSALSSQMNQLDSLLGLPSSSIGATGTAGAGNSQGLTNNQLMGMEAQQLLNSDLASFGTDGSSGINTLV